MRYQLQTLMIGLALLPPLGAARYWLSLRPQQKWLTEEGFPDLRSLPLSPKFKLSREIEEQPKAATPENEWLKTQIAPYVAVATLDVQKVFEKSQKHNAAMASIKAKLEAPNAYFDPNKSKVLSDEAKVYFETYQRMDEIVARICKTKSIGLVIRAKLDSMDPSDRASVLQGINRPVVYSAVPDVTEEVIAELDR